jgi:DUF4097 and DUF4098 domain-containing protein YvlB
MPPGGGAPPPYDPRTQYRAYREQQKAAWRAQRDAWRAQRHAWKGSYMGPYGPRIPSIVGPLILVSIGVVALLVMTGHISGGSFWAWYGHWWPVLLIVAGLALLGEWFLDMQRKTPVRRSGSFVGILLLIAFLGIFATGWNHFGPFANSWNGDNDFFNFFGLPEHDFDQPLDNIQVPPSASIQILNPRGDVSITAADQPNLQVQAHEIAFANSDSDAKKIFDSEAAKVTVSGTSVLVESDSNDHGRVNLTITVPRTAHLTVNAGRGDVAASGLGAGINVTAPHGDVHLNTIAGTVMAHLAKGEFSAHDLQGDLSSDGPCTDVTLSDIKGGVNLNCEYFGEIHLEHVAGPVHLHSQSDIELAQLDGDLTLSDNSLNVSQARGPVHIVTHSRDVDLSDIAGDTSVQDRDGTISIEPAGPYSVEARNNKGDVELTLPPNASATVDGHTHNGDIVTEYGLTIGGEEDKTVNGRIGSGAAHIVLNAENGDIHIKKGSAFPPAPQSPPNAPANPDARHLKSTKPLPPQPVAQ